jgi:hypothetical protein
MVLTLIGIGMSPLSQRADSENAHGLSARLPAI